MVCLIQSVKFEVSNLASTSPAISLQNIICFYMSNKAICIHTTEFCIFPKFKIQISNTKNSCITVLLRSNIDKPK